MRGLAGTLVVVAIVTGACGDTAEPRPYIEPVPFDPAVDLTTTTTAMAAASSTTLGFLASSAAAAAGAFDALVEEHGLTDVATGAWGDFAAAGCDEGVWDRAVNFALADDFSGLYFPSLESVSGDQVLVAQMLWLKSVEVCAADFPPGAIGRGPPTIYEYPRCRHRLEPGALPWSDDVGEADSGQDQGVGVAYQVWSAGDQTFAIIQGADPAFDDDYNSGTSAGTINGNDARILDIAVGVHVIWRQGPGHCDAFRMFFQPQPETDDLVALAQSLLEPPAGFSGNEAEVRMAAAVGLVAGYADAGGEPSHGGPDAVYGFTDDAGWFDVHAVPAEVADPNPPLVSDMLDVDGTVFELFYDDQGGNIITRGVSFVADDFRITIRTTPDDERLMTFALEFRRAWLAAAAPD